MTATTETGSTPRPLDPGEARIAARGIGGRLSSLASQETVLTVILVVITVLVGLVNQRFWITGNITDILSNASYVSIAAIGISMVIISGNIDISTGALIGLLATMAGRVALGAAEGGYPVQLAFLVPIIVGPLYGTFVGFLVAYLRIPAIVVTLGMMSILQGGLILWTGGEWIYNLPPEFMIAQGSLLGIPVPVYFMVTLTILAALWMRYSATGRAIYAVGGNKDAARLSGISERAVLMRVFIVHGFMVGVASVLYGTQFNAIQSTVPPGLALQIITASVVGGVSILGGTGTVIGSTLGAVLIFLLPPAMTFISISAYWRDAVYGLLILITVLADLLRRRRQTLARGD